MSGCPILSTEGFFGSYGIDIVGIPHFKDRCISEGLAGRGEIELSTYHFVIGHEFLLDKNNCRPNTLLVNTWHRKLRQDFEVIVAFTTIVFMPLGKSVTLCEA